MRWTLVTLGMLLVLAACASTDPEPAPTHLVSGRVTAGPVCPVVSDPPDPSCADRPVGGASLVVTDDEGTRVGSVTTEDDGSYRILLPAGRYLLEPAPVPGLLGTPDPVEIVITDTPISVDLVYDTGIR